MESHLHSEALKVELRHFAKETLQQELTSLGGRIEVALCSRLQQVLDSWASDTFHATPKSPMSSRNNKSLHDKSIHSLHDKSVHSAYYSSEHNSIKSSSEHNFEEKKSDEDRSSGGKASIETAPPFQPNGSNDIGGKGRQRLSRLTVNQANNLSRLPDQLADRITMRVQESDAVEDKSSWSFRRPKGYGFRDLQTSQLSLNNFKPLAWVSKRLSWVENQDSQTPGEGSLYEVLSPVLSPEVTGDGEHSPSDAQRWTVASNTSRKTRSTHHTVVFAETTMHSPRDMDKSERSTYSRLERMNTDNGDQIEYARYSEAARERAGSNWGRSVQRYSFASKTSEDDSYDIMKSRQYNFLLGFLIIANSIMTGALTEYQAAHHTSAIPWSFRAPELVFASIFALEIGTRICLHGCSFLTKPGWHWNLFDLIVVIMQVGEDAFSLWMELSHSQSESRRPTTLEMKLFPILSFMRSARIFRLARIFHLIAELRMLLASIANSFRSLLWTVVMLLALTYMVAVYITQFVLDHRLRLTRDDSEEDSAQLLVELYGTLPRSMLTLYESISDGVHWKHVMDPLREEVSPWLALTFSLYISFVIFAMLNLIHGVYVESIIRTASEDKRRVLMMEMHQLFLQADVDGSGTITWEEFGAQLEKSEMRSYLKEIDLDLEEARELFLLLDTEEEGEIDIEQLVNGCVRLHGTAKAMDLAVMMQEMKRMARQLNSHAHVVEEQLTWLVQQSTRMVNDASDTSLEQLQMTALRSQLPKSR